MTHKLVIVKKRDPERDPRVTFFLLFFPSLRLCSARRILKSDWVNLTFAALRLTFIRGHEGFLKFHADRVIIGLPCGQGQLSRIWKVQRDWLSLGKECCPWLSRRLWEGTKKTPAWEAAFFSYFLFCKYEFVKIISRVPIKSHLFSNVYHWFLP